MLNANVLQATLSTGQHRFTPSALEIDQSRMALGHMLVHRLIIAQSRPTRGQIAIRCQFMRMSQKHVGTTIVEIRMPNQTQLTLENDPIDLGERRMCIGSVHTEMSLNQIK